MATSNSASADRRSQVHTEVRTPVEVVLSRVVSFVFGAIEVVIAARFLLKLLGANPKSGFVQLVFSVSDIFMVPFNSVFRAQHVSGTTFEWSALVAIAVYALLGWGAVALIRAVSPREAAQTVERVVKDDEVRTP